MISSSSSLEFNDPSTLKNDTNSTMGPTLTTPDTTLNETQVIFINSILNIKYI